MPKFLHVFLALCLTHAGALYAQTPKDAPKFTISGYIEDAETGERLKGASVLDVRSGAGITTNDYGFYSLTLPQDSLIIAVSYVGLQNQYFKLWLDRDAHIDFKLEPTTLGTVEVVADEVEDKLEERNQMSQISIPIEQIKALPAILGEVDVLKVVQLLPGVQAGEGSSGLYVRGGSPDQNLILLDGAPVYNVYHLFGFFSVFNADAIKSVNLTKGGYPARHGGRLASVLEINMKEGNMKKVSGEGSIGLISSRFTIEAPIKKDKTSFIISARRTYIDILTKPLFWLASSSASGGSVMSAPGYYFYDLNAKINHIIDAKNRLYLSFYGGQDKFSFSTKYTSPDETATNKFRLQWGNMTGSLRWNHLFNNKLFSNTSLTYSRYNFLIGASYEYHDNSNNQTSSFNATYSSGIEDWAIKTDFDYLPTPNHHIRFGAGATFHTFRPGASVIRYADASQTLNTTAGDKPTTAGEFMSYIEDDIRINDKMGVNIGVHTSGFLVQNKFYASAQPRVSARYMLPAQIALKGSFATMTQYIHLLTNEGFGLPTDLWVSSTANIRPEQSWQAALGFAKTFNKMYEVSIEGYYRSMRNMISYKPGASYMQLDGETTTANAWEQKVNGNGLGEAYGAELFVHKKRGKLTGWISYTLAWNWRQFPNSDINWGQRYPFKYDRRHNIAITGMYEFSPRVSMSALWVYGTGNAVSLPTETYLAPDGSQVDVMTSKNSFRMPPYHRLDVSINLKKERKKWSSTWSFGVYNLYSRRNPYFILADGQTQNGTRVYRQVSLFPIIPSVRWDFKF